MLAAASIGAIWSSTSPDFGINVSNLSAEQPLLCPRQRWGWGIWVADGFCSLQPCCHLLAQPSTPELFQLHKPSSRSVVTTHFQLGGLSGFSCSLLGYFQMGSMVLVSFCYIKYASEQQCSRVVWSLLFFPSPTQAAYPHSDSTPQFLCLSCPILCSCQGELSTTLVGFFPQGFICHQWGILY